MSVFHASPSELLYTARITNAGIRLVNLDAISSYNIYPSQDYCIARKVVGSVSSDPKVLILHIPEVGLYILDGHHTYLRSIIHDTTNTTKVLLLDKIVLDNYTRLFEDKTSNLFSEYINIINYAR